MLQYYLLIPILFYLDELKRESEFYHSRGLSCPKDILANNEIVDMKKNQNENQNDTDFHRFDEQVSLIYQYLHSNLKK